MRIRQFTLSSFTASSLARILHPGPIVLEASAQLTELTGHPPIYDDGSVQP